MLRSEAARPKFELGASLHHSESQFSRLQNGGNGPGAQGPSLSPYEPLVRKISKGSLSGSLGLQGLWLEDVPRSLHTGEVALVLNSSELQRCFPGDLEGPMVGDFRGGAGLCTEHAKGLRNLLSEQRQFLPPLRVHAGHFRSPHHTHFWPWETTHEGQIKGLPGALASGWIQREGPAEDEVSEAGVLPSRKVTLS